MIVPITSTLPLYKPGEIAKKKKLHFQKDKNKKLRKVRESFFVMLNLILRAFPLH